MALIERLMHWGGDNPEPPEDVDPEPDARHIDNHQFFAAVAEVAIGPRTGAQIKSFYAMTAGDIVDFDNLASLVVGNDAAKALTLLQIQSVFILGETRVPNYSSPVEMRSRFSIPKPA